MTQDRVARRANDEMRNQAVRRKNAELGNHNGRKKMDRWKKVRDGAAGNDA